jgi:hypothetical protein
MTRKLDPDNPLDVAEAGLATGLSAKDDAERVARGTKLADATARAALDRAQNLSPSPQEIAAERSLAARMADQARLRLSPRRRYAELERFDDKVRALEERQGAILRQLDETRGQIRLAEGEYRAALTAWHRRPRGQRPTDPRPDLEQRVVDLQEDLDAVSELITETLEARAAFVQKYRRELVKDARRVADEALERYSRAAAELLDARMALMDARADEVRARLYPDERAATPPGTAMIPAGRLRELREIVGLQAPLDPEALRRVLATDGEFLRSRLTQPQRQALKERGEVTPDPYEEAVWAGSEEWKKQVREDEERRREAYRREWGQEPPW